MIDFSGVRSGKPVFLRAMKALIPAPFREILILPVILAALGYFVDVMDIWLFGTNRVASLKDIGVPPENILDVGVYLLNMQMGGLLLGGILFGILGDKFGRTRVMFASILTYSVGTLANAFVHDIHSYAFFRFVSGIGLAGELGLAITLICEILPKERRGMGTGLIATFGILGAIGAATLSELFDWRTCYIIGGLAGLILLAFRMKVGESHIYKDVSKKSDVVRGDLSLFFSSWKRTLRFLKWVCLSLPVWFVAGIMVVFAPELVKARFGIEFSTSTLLFYSTLAIAAGDFASAWISQVVKNRRIVIICFYFLSLLTMGGFFLAPHTLSREAIIAFYVMMTFTVGCWVLIVTAVSEDFGTNLRATVTAALPNFSRGSTILTTFAITHLKDHMPLADAMLWTGLGVFLLAILAILFAAETFGKPLDYLEN